MIKVLVKSLNMKAYLVGAATIPVVRQVMGGFPPAPTKGSGVILPEVKQVRDFMPMLYVVLEDGRGGLVNVNDVVPLMTDEQKQDLESTEVPVELREEAEKLVEMLNSLEQAAQGEQGEPGPSPLGAADGDKEAIK